ncbi:MAG TPA: DUF3078 domain-containing protein [Rhodothermales bacterium]
MRQVLLLVAAVLIAPRVATAQDPAAVPDSAAAPTDWATELVGRIAVTQAGYSNWAKGGINSVAVSSGLGGAFDRTTPGWIQEHEFKLALGVVKQDTLEFQKADDEIMTSSALQYRGGGFFRLFNPTFALQTRTQFAPGFNYKKNPFEDGREPPVKVSDFFSPAVFTQTLGLTYSPSPWFTQRFGVASKQTIVLIERFRSLYGVPESSPGLVEVGFESRTQVDREVFENVRLKSSLGLFAAFNKPDMPDLMWENLIEMKVNAWLGVNVQLDLLYDRDISNALQVKEVFTLGITYAFL